MDWQTLVDEAAQRIALAVAQNIAGRAYTHTEATERTTEAPRADGNAKESHAAYIRACYHEHKAQGLCVKCSDKATHGVFCEKHQRSNVQNSANQYEKIKALKALNVSSLMDKRK